MTSLLDEVSKYIPKILGTTRAFQIQPESSTTRTSKKKLSLEVKGIQIHRGNKARKKTIKPARLNNP